jgi:alpha-L-fucosidase
MLRKAVLGMSILVGVLSMRTISNAGSVAWESTTTKTKVDAIVSKTDQGVAKGPFKADWDSLKERQIPDWYRDAKFGIFIHWGVFSVPAFNNEWYSRNMYQKDSDEYKHQVATYGPLDKFGYKDFIPMFKAENFSPEGWVSLFKEAGAKYIVPVAEHHDGFAMYDTALSRWSAVKMGPQRDVIGLLAAAARKEGLVFGLSSHRAEHWWFMNGGRKFPSDVQDPKFADFYGPAVDDDSAPNKEYLRNWLARSVELVDQYHPQVVYFDWWIGEKKEFDPYVREFAAYYYDQADKRKEGVVLNTKDKAYVPGTSVMDVERGGLPDIRPEPWQTCTSISWGSWCFVENDHYKDSGLLIRNLIDTVSKNGNLLLNVGPKPDGTIPQETVKVLREMGAWLKVNGEGIYGTRPWTTFGEGPTKEKMGKFQEAAVNYQEGDVRYTVKGNHLYVFALVPPTKSLVLSALGSLASPSLDIKAVERVGDGAKVEWNRTAKALVLKSPKPDGRLPMVFKVTLDGTKLGRLRSEASVNKVDVTADLQNYGEKAVVPEMTLMVDGKRSASSPVTVGSEASAEVKLVFKADHPGVFHLSLFGAGETLPALSVTLPVLDLTGMWWFHKGDRDEWRKPETSEEGWEKVALPDNWEHHSQYTDDNVYGWYRLHVFVPAEWKGHDLKLPLGKIDDCDISYVNGNEVGRMGVFPPKFSTAWNEERHYVVPAKMIKFGGDNVIAIRVFDGTGNGGLDAGPLSPVEAVQK